MENAENNEAVKFNRLADYWWDQDGPLKTLHDINPLRLGYIEQILELKDRAVLDVGCGAGILSESLAIQGAGVTGIDISQEVLEVARKHAEATSLDIKYLLTTPEALAKSGTRQFDIITCMEMLEHVPDPESVIISCNQLLKPGGHVFFSTISRSVKSYLLAIVAAEYLFRLVPTGTHDYGRFIRPHELVTWCEDNDFRVHDISGMTYLPVVRKALLTGRPNVNYLVHAQKN